MSTTPSRARSVYRSLLRELPRRALSDPSPVKRRIRGSFAADGAGAGAAQVDRQLAEAEQFVRYARAQRLYATLLDRYNPGLGMSEEERHRLSVRRVGMSLPEEWKPEREPERQ